MLQVQIQRFKEVSQMDLVQSFPLLLSGYEDILSLSFVLGHQLLCVCWVFISATDLQLLLQNINKFAAG